MKPEHKSLTLDQAKYWKNQGLMTEEEFEAYFHEWSQVPRFSTFCRCEKCHREFPHRFLPE